MRILFSLRDFELVYGGAEKSIRTFIKHLKESNEIIVVCTGNKNDERIHENYKIITKKIKRIPYPQRFPSIEWVQIFAEMLQWEKIIKRVINVESPEIVITQLHFAPPTIKKCREIGVNSVLFLRSYEHFCPIGFYDVEINDCDMNCMKCLSPFTRVQYLVIKKIMKWHADSIKYANLVIANSNYMKTSAKKFYDINPEVVYPPVIKDDVKTKVNGEWILFVGSAEHKGAHLVPRIAERIPDEKFVMLGNVVPHILRDARRVKNVTVLKPIKDMRCIYRKTKLLIMPSQWPEPFGRMPVEAGFSGIPTVASDVGGLKEAVGEGGILIKDYKNVYAWVDAIKHILENKEEYKEFSEAAQWNAKKFESFKVYNEFKDILKKCLGAEV